MATASGVNQVHATTNYKRFKILSYNRPLVKATLKKLETLTESENRMPMYPITVDKDFSIIDGQHRFAVCKKMKLPVSYIKLRRKATWEDVYNSNTVGRRHNISQLIELIVNNKPTGDLKKLKEVYAPYKDTTLLISTIAQLLFEFQNSGKTVEAIKSGKFKINHLIETQAMLDFCDSLHVDMHFHNAYRNKFVFAIVSIVRAYDLDLVDFLKHIYSNREKLRSKAMSKQGYIDHLIEIHDSGRRASNRLRKAVY
jgi:hypothetical protein